MGVGGEVWGERGGAQVTVRRIGGCSDQYRAGGGGDPTERERGRVRERELGPTQPGSDATADPGGGERGPHHTNTHTRPQPPCQRPTVNIVTQRAAPTVLVRHPL